MSDCPKLYKICVLFAFSEGGAAGAARALPGVAPRRGALTAAPFV